MGKNKDKNDKDGVPNPAGVANRDILQRLNFLYQASVLLNGLATPGSVFPDDPTSSTRSEPVDECEVGVEQPANAPPSSTERGMEKRGKNKKTRRRRRVVGFEELSRSYVETMKSVGQKTNVRIDPSVKRCICKRCSSPLIPGVSATVRIKDSSSHGHFVSYRCNCCREERRIPAPPVLRLDPPTNAEQDAAMQVQPTEAPTSIAPEVSVQRKRRKKGPQPRLPPHFARDVGHVVFCGNERIKQDLHSLSLT